jgi:hypothetical protein
MQDITAAKESLVCSGRMTGKPESAGINRHVVGDARALQERK